MSAQAPIAWWAGETGVCYVPSISQESLSNPTDVKYGHSFWCNSFSSSRINPQPFVHNKKVPIVTVPNAPLVQVVTTPPLTRACAGPSQSSRQECQVQDLQSLLLLSSLLLNCTRTASFTLLFLLAAL